MIIIYCCSQSTSCILWWSEIKDVKKKKERAKELEGIDLSNIVSSSRRRSTSSYVAPPPKPKIPVKTEGDDVDDTDDEEEEEEDDDDEDGEEEDDEEDNGDVDESQGEEEFNEGNKPSTFKVDLLIFVYHVFLKKLWKFLNLIWWLIDSASGLVILSWAWCGFFFSQMIMKTVIETRRSIQDSRVWSLIS